MRMYFCSRAGGIKGITLAAKRSSRWPASFLPMIYSFMCLTPLVGTIIDDLLERGKGYLRLLAREGGRDGSDAAHRVSACSLRKNVYPSRPGAGDNPSSVPAHGELLGLQQKVQQGGQRLPVGLWLRPFSCRLARNCSIVSSVSRAFARSLFIACTPFLSAAPALAERRTFLPGIFRVQNLLERD